MDKNRFETQKHIVRINLENKPQIFFTRDDLKWLIKQSEKAERYEKALHEIQRYVNYVGEPIEVYNITEKAIKNK